MTVEEDIMTMRLGAPKPPSKMSASELITIATRPAVVKAKYVLGFCFMHYNTEVVLIRKNKPEWQKGLLNGIGGKIEPGENPMEAMIREWREETGTYITDWHRFITMDFSGAIVFVFKCQMVGGVNVQSPTQEPVGTFNVTTALALSTIVPNLRWLIPMALYDSQTDQSHWKGAPTLYYP